MAIEFRGALYEDRLVRVTRASIVFRHYYFPFGPKQVDFGEIERIEIRRKPSWVWRWKIHGGPDFRTWMPLDIRRPKRDRIYLLRLKNKWRQIAFTVEHPEKFERTFERVGLSALEGPLKPARA